jgi:L-gulono-1,4-lactone dehydrogenase
VLAGLAGANQYLDAHRWAEFSVFKYAQDALARSADEADGEPDPVGAPPAERPA